MELRNKKTGEVIKTTFNFRLNHTYSSIAELIDEWEDVPEDDVKDFPNFEYWKLDGIKSKLTGLTVAPENVTKAIAGDIGTEVDGKMYFTYDEAMELEEKVLKPNGWRLPTRSEWVLLCEEFGQDENGKLNGSALAKNLNLPMDGWLDEDGSSALNVGSYGLYWSSSVYDSSYAYYLYFFSSSAGTYYDYKRSGNSVRCVWSGS